jgi:hypothetical protein
VSFSDDTHGTIVWPGGTIPIVRDIFDAGVASFQPESGWWWDPNQSGSGYSIEVQGSNLFIVGFMYDDAGNPVWYLSAGPMSTPTTYHGNLLFIAGGQTESGPYHPPSTATTIATLDVSFTAVDQATLTFTEAPVAGATSMRPLVGRNSQRNIQRQYKPPKLVLPNTYKGSYNLTDVQHTVTQGSAAILDTTYLIDFLNVTWTKDDDLSLPPSHVYQLTSGSLHVEFAQGESTAAGFCSASLTIDRDLTTLSPNNFSLVVNDNGRYSLSMQLNPGDVHDVTTITCSFGGPGAPVPVIPTAGGTFEGKVTGTEFKLGGKLTVISTNNGVTVTDTVTKGFDFMAGP